MCWHKWSKWADYSLTPVEETDYSNIPEFGALEYSKGERVLQIRRCGKCNKLKMRKVWLEK